MSKIKLAVLLGTTRPENKSQHLARYITKIANEGNAFEATLVDPANYNFPGDGNDPAGKDANYTKITEESEAFLIVVPEYNHGYPGSLKRMLDSELKNYIHKPVAMAGISSGRFSGVRAIEALVPVVRELGLAVTFSDVRVGGSYDAFNEQDEPQNDYIPQEVERALEELEWMSNTLKYGRENVPSKHHRITEQSASQD
jgi:NAD(P)H-dependent FMN reductase